MTDQTNDDTMPSEEGLASYVRERVELAGSGTNADPLNPVLPDGVEQWTCIEHGDIEAGERWMVVDYVLPSPIAPSA